MRRVDQHVRGWNLRPTRNLVAHRRDRGLLEADQVRGHDGGSSLAIVEHDRLGVQVEVNADRRPTTRIALQVAANWRSNVDRRDTGLKLRHD